jgi:hypothetical protein
MEGKKQKAVVTHSLKMDCAGMACLFYPERALLIGLAFFFESAHSFLFLLGPSA